MGSMFNVRSARALAPYGPESGLLSVHAACAATAPHAHLPPPGLHLAPPSYEPPFRPSAERKLFVGREQVAHHPLRVGGHLGFRLSWLWLELGSGKLRVR